MVSRLERSMSPGCAGDGRQHDARATSSPAAARALERHQGVADRAEPGPRRDHERHAEVGGKVAHEVVAGQRDQQPADALRHEHVAARPRRGGPRPAGRCGLDALAGGRRGQVGRHRRAEAVRGDVRRTLRRARGGAQTLVVGRPCRPGSSRPVTAGLKTETRSPSAASVAAMADATTVLPTSVSVPVTNRPGAGRDPRYAA